MSLRPKARGFSRTIFDMLEENGPMSRSAIAKELRERNKSASSKQLLTCIKNMRHRGWIEVTPDDRRKFDITSDLLKNQRDPQGIMFNKRGKVTIRPFTTTPIESPTPVVKTSENSQIRPISAPTVPLPVQVAGMVLVTAIVTAVSTALAMRMF